ncbi:MAG: J domain-containing protein, partial [Actinomycetota bacterium]
MASSSQPQPHHERLRCVIGRTLTPSPRANLGVTNHYQRLGVAHSASAGEIHAAYRASARLLHPDAVAGDDRAMQDLNEAWSVLRDPARR